MGDERPHDARQTGGRRIRTRHIAILALAVAIGHVVYAILRDHVFHGSPILPWLSIGPTG